MVRQIKNRIKIKGIKSFLERLPWILAEKAFLTFLILFFVALILGGFIFYKYSFLIRKTEPKIKEKPFSFEENFYQKILSQWDIREKKFKEAELKEYPNPFRGLSE